jgi:hypothetical protein
LPNLRRKSLSRYFPPKVSFFFLNRKIDKNESDLLPPIRSSGFNLKLTEIAENRGPLEWALELRGRTPTSISGRGK